MQNDLRASVLFPDGRGEAEGRGRTPFDKDNLGDRRDSLLEALSSWWAEDGMATDTCNNATGTQGRFRTSEGYCFAASGSRTFCTPHRRLLPETKLDP